ncbi:RIO1 family-domain-containing protein [Cladochytrium replicatum]|nr:RIO1 family-domain-containing protein [Cladochytrium replicatum]
MFVGGQFDDADEPEVSHEELGSLQTYARMNEDLNADEDAHPLPEPAVVGHVDEISSTDDFSDDDEMEDADVGLNYVDLWSQASSDFTKQYNRLRNVQAAAAGTAAKNPISPAQVIAVKGQVTSKVSRQVALEKLGVKFKDRLKLDGDESPLPVAPAPGGMSGSRKADGARQKNTDKSDRATVEQVLDPRTRMIIFKMLNSNIIFEINGCISTGKEANVYHASTEDGQHRAIKVYKTSILVFKDRDRYVSGEYRFRHGYSKSNPRKMVRVWAEKEMRNLKRLHSAGLPCPEPLLLRMHVLLMTFVGDKSGWAAPRLKDAAVKTTEAYRDLYFQLLRIAWKMYHRCKLVHADLSEYNLLVHKGVLYVIDVSQAVEHDHPHALEFLRKDCSNIVDYFRRMLGPQSVMTVRELFDFVVSDQKQLLLHLQSGKWNGSVDSATDPNSARAIEEQILDAYLDHVHEEIAKRPASYLESVQVDEEVFKKAYIPRTLEEVIDIESDSQKILSGTGNELFYTSVTGLSISQPERPANAGPTVHTAPFTTSLPGSKAVKEDSSRAIDQAGVDDAESDSDSSADSDSEDGEPGEQQNETGSAPSLKRLEDKQAKKERKQAVKEEKREKRKKKIPKAVKKRKQKVATDRGKGK